VKPRDWVKFEHAAVPVRCVVSRVKRPAQSVSSGWCGGREAGGVAKPPKSHSQIRYSMALTLRSLGLWLGEGGTWHQSSYSV
jgi:hypothetical protein